MKGPVAILEDTNVLQKMHLSSQQLTNMSDILESYKKVLPPLRNRLIGLQVNTVRPRDTGDVRSELANLAKVMKEIEKDQDFEIVDLLNREQRQLWTDLSGAPASINWPMETFAELPFGEN